MTSNVLVPVAEVPLAWTVDLTVPAAALLISDLNVPVEPSSATPSTPAVAVPPGVQNVTPTVVHGADQRREMGAAHNPAGRTLVVPVACKRYRVCCCGLRVRQFRLHTKDNGYKEKKPHRGLGNIAEDSGETQKTPPPKKRRYRPGATGQAYPAVCQISAEPFQVKQYPEFGTFPSRKPQDSSINPPYIP